MKQSAGRANGMRCLGVCTSCRHCAQFSDRWCSHLVICRLVSMLCPYMLIAYMQQLYSPFAFRLTCLNSPELRTSPTLDPLCSDLERPA